jgi:hypothetical protein
MVVLFGLLDIAGEPFRTGRPLDRFDGAMIRQLQRDPMWRRARHPELSSEPGPASFVHVLAI